MDGGRGAVSGDSTESLHAELHAAWANGRGWRAPVTVSHGALGLRFIYTGMGFFLFGGLLAMLMRAQLALPGRVFMPPDVYAQMFTLHGSVMMFLFATPVMEGLAVYLLPKMLGARDLVFPRLSAFGYWCYLFGGLILISSLFLGVAPDGGWFMYPPLTGAHYSPGPNTDVWLIGITFVEISAVSAGVELAVSILYARAPGMSLDRMPLFAWYILVMALMIVAGFPPLILGSILLELERVVGLPFFDPTRGGDPVLWQHLFWLFGHPEVYIIFLPAAGIVSTLVPVFARHPPVGYRAVVIAVISTGFISFGLWVHHMFAVGMPLLSQAFFSASSMLVAIPTGVQVFSWLATLWRGRPVAHVPMLWLGGFLFIFVAGGLTGVMLALVPFDLQVHDTHFVVAHLHYVLVGGMLFPLIAGLYYWLPHFSGRMPSLALGRWGFWLVFIGFNLGFLVMHWTGLLGMPRRVHTYAPELGWDLPNLLSSIGAFVMAGGVACVLADLLLHARYGAPAPPDPWGADTLEWAMQTPAPAYNFVSLPTVSSRHPLWDQPDLASRLQRGDGLLPGAPGGRRETLGCDPVSGEARSVIVLPGNTWLPFAAAAVIAVVCIALLTKAYIVAAIAAVAALCVLLCWSWQNGVHPLPDDSVPAGLPLHPVAADGPGLRGMGLTLVADGALYLSLLFGWFYLWVVPPSAVALLCRSSGLWASGSPASLLLLVAAACATGAALALRWSARRLLRGEGRHLLGGVLAAALLCLLAAVALALGWSRAGLAPTVDARDAAAAVVLGCNLVHLLLAAIVLALQVARVRCGRVGVHAPYEPRVAGLLCGYNALALWAAWVALVPFPQAWGGT
ncbi:MAG: cytochrome c oxidase subunit I [Pseudomonadota bacterium]